MEFDYMAIRKVTRIPIITIFAHPRDYPIGYVARVFDLNIPTDIALTAPTLELIRTTIPYHMTRFPRDPKDDPHIVESYI